MAHHIPKTPRAARAVLPSLRSESSYGSGVSLLTKKHSITEKGSQLPRSLYGSRCSHRTQGLLLGL